MMQEKLKEIRDLLTEVKYPGTSKNIVELDMVQNIRICAMLWKNCSSMTHPFPSSRRPPKHWALVSAADFWDFCTWRSFRSVWNVSLTLT